MTERARSRFTAGEWEAIARAPLLAAMMVIAADGRGNARATLAAARAWGKVSRDAYGSLVGELLGERMAALGEPFRDRAALRDEVPAALREAVAIVDRAGSDDDRREYRRFVLELARAAGSARRRRRSGDARTEGRREAVAAIQAILDTDACT